MPQLDDTLVRRQPETHDVEVVGCSCPTNPTCAAIDTTRFDVGTCNALAMATCVLVEAKVGLAVRIRADEVPSSLPRIARITFLQADFAADPLFSTRNLGDETVLPHRLMSAAQEVVGIMRIFAAAQEDEAGFLCSCRPSDCLTVRADRFVRPNNRDPDFERAAARYTTDRDMLTIFDPR